VLGSGWVGVQRICSRIVAMSSLGLSSALSRMALNLVVCSRTSARRCSRVDMIARLQRPGQYSLVLLLAARRESYPALRCSVFSWACERSKSGDKPLIETQGFL